MDDDLELPAPAYAPDAPLASLCAAELLLLTTARLFVLPGRAAAHGMDWRDGLKSAGVAACAAPAIEALFAVVGATQRRPLDFRCPCRRQLGADEGRLLQLIGLYQQGRCRAAEAVLGDWLPPAARRMASLPAHVIAAAMERRGLVIPRRSADGRPRYRPARPYGDRPASTLH